MTPIFFFGRSLLFVILSIILKNKKDLCVGSFNYFSYTIQIGSNWYMDTGVRDLEVVFVRLILPDLISTCSQSFKKICTWEILAANVFKQWPSAQSLFIFVLSAGARSMTWHVICVRSKDAQKQLVRTSLSLST